MGFYLRRLALFALLAFTTFVPLGARSTAEAATGASAGRIIYLASDGVSIRSIKPDGTGLALIYTVKVAKGTTVDNLSADPTGSYILYSTYNGNDNGDDVYHLLHNGAVRNLPALSRVPKWSPDGVRFVAEARNTTTLPGNVFIYNVLNNTYLYLPARGLPDWYPDGTKLVYTDESDVFSYNRVTGAITKLTHFPHQENGNDWGMQEAHVLPGSQRIAFFGQQFKVNGQFQLGASGNGQQWFTIPATGIAAGVAPQPWLEPEGNAIVGYASTPASNKVAYAGNGHDSACAAYEDVGVLSSTRFPGHAIYANIPEFNDKTSHYVYIQGLAWSPVGSQVAFGVVPYTCDMIVAPVMKPSILYTWDVSAGGTKLRKLANGSYPVWTTR